MKLKYLTTASALLTSALLIAPATSAVRHYAADLSNSNWEVTEQSALQCELEHQVPRYGRVKFVSEASKQLNLRMRLEFLQLPDSYDIASVKSIAPNWWPGSSTYELGEMKLYKQFNSELPKQAAWTVLTELEKGRHPTFFYQDWYNERDQVAVGLSAANFRRNYDDFLNCVSGLLKFSFEDIAYTVLNYDDDNGELTREAQQKLMQIGQYLSHDTDLELVLIDAYTDAYGAREPNQRLTEERAEMIKSFFTERGINGERIVTVGHGERRHIAGNDDELARAQNRRVVIQLSKPLLGML
ncbi:OmpA family protein [Pseudidiomarina planktonica]|uniref:OmpA family protein n=1 Tax=Pseudidiomarina planktonica TaxID=1323738 RepID=A0A1Y6F1B5_9GAMM|nr:OmpA family protein [Pseudidiomarina planktonica]RUO64986.1 OmpA family protein [Pseudidiomarina planktonica]SMQ68678.1 OmpA family protein [Pseudidiomarina planktonica]